MKRTLCGLLLLLFLLAVPIAVSAEGTEIDWNKVDWETFDWNQLSEHSPWKWLTTDASFHDVFTFLTSYKAAQVEWYSESIQHGIYLRFGAEPEKFLIALAKEKAEVQAFVVDDLAIYMAVFETPNETVPILEGIRLSKEQNPKAVELMLTLIDKVQNKLIENKYNVTITIPKTGDPVMLAVTALLLSGTGFALLRKKKV